MGLLDFDYSSPRIQAACGRLKAAYDRVPGHEVPVVEPNCRGPVRDAVPAHTLTELDKLVHDAAARANGLAAVDQDFPPYINTLNGVPQVAQAFGCKVVYGADNVPWTYPAISDIKQVYQLKPMKLTEAPLLCMLREYVDYAQRKLGANVPFWTMDLQSPFSVAEQVLGPDLLFSSIYDDPAALHHLLKMITEFSIEMLQDHIAQMEHPGFPGRNFPSISENIGICLSDDTPLVMLSPEHYRQFSLPYNSRIAQAFGGVHVHSCGNYAHNLDNLLSIPGIRSIQFHAGPNEFILPSTAQDDHPINRARQQVTCFLDWTPVCLGDAYRNQPQRMYEQYVLPWLKSGSLDGLIIQSPGGDEATRWTRRQVARC